MSIHLLDSTYLIKKKLSYMLIN